MLKLVLCLVFFFGCCSSRYVDSYINKEEKKTCYTWVKKIRKKRSNKINSDSPYIYLLLYILLRIQEKIGRVSFITFTQFEINPSRRSIATFLNHFYLCLVFLVSTERYRWKMKKNKTFWLAIVKKNAENIDAGNQ